MKDFKPTVWEAVIGVGVAGLATLVLSAPVFEERMKNLETKASAARFTRDDGDDLRQQINDLRCELTNRLTYLEASVGHKEACPDGD